MGTCVSYGATVSTTGSSLSNCVCCACSRVQVYVPANERAWALCWGSCESKVIKEAHRHATQCNTLEITATQCNTHKVVEEACRPTTHCNTLQLNATQCNKSQGGEGGSSLYNSLQRNATHCNILQHTTEWQKRLVVLILQVLQVLFAGFVLQMSRQFLGSFAEEMKYEKSFPPRRHFVGCCSVLQCVAVCYSVLKCVTVCSKAMRLLCHSVVLARYC